MSKRKARDFGDILEQWENGSSGTAKKPVHNKPPVKTPKKADAVPSRDLVTKKPVKRNPSAKNPVEVWLDRYGTTDKDAAAEKQERLHIAPKNLPVEAHLDLHGLSRDEAWRQLSDFIDLCCRKGFRKVLIIHGKGNHSGTTAVLSSMVQEFIRRSPRLGASGHPDNRDGGSGATWVVVKGIGR
ncbi:MAG: Smr/MutS family protein [Spirochaetaceae bacterium]|nr:Smr/MutS family protein [Spirochaetaceae bacterium]